MSRAIVAIVGVDGSGKSTQARTLVSNLRVKGIRAACVRPVLMLSDMVPLLRVGKLASISPRRKRVSRHEQAQKVSFATRYFLTSLLGYAYALVTYVLLRSRPGIVVCDRYFYQFFMDLCGDQADNFIRIFPRADLTIFLDLDPITLRQRTLNSFDVTVPEGYYVNIIRKFRELSARYGFVQIDANLGREEISVLIYDILLKSLRMR